MSADIIHFVPRTEHLVREAEQSYRAAIDRVNAATYREIYGPSKDEPPPAEYIAPPCDCA